MQISDELLVRLETAINTVMDDAEVDYPIGYHKGMHRVSWDAAEMRRALAAALSLPVQPVAWPEGFFKLGGDNRLRECASDGCHQHVSIRVERSGVGSDHCEPCARKIADLLTTPPISPTKGPEDDLIAAREAAEDIEINYVVCDPKEVREQVAAAIMDALRKDRAIRSRPASALPEVGERIKPLEWYPDPGAFPYNTWGAQSSFGRFIIEEVSASDSPAYEARYTPHHLITIKDSLEDAKAAAQADYERRILSALIPSVQP